MEKTYSILYELILEERKNLFSSMVKRIVLEIELTFSSLKNLNIFDKAKLYFDCLEEVQYNLAKLLQA